MALIKNIKSGSIDEVDIIGNLDVSGSGRFTNGLTVSGSILASGSIIPATDGVSTTSSFDLGSATNAWKDIWVSNGTINFLDGAGNVQAALSSTDQGLQIQNYPADTGSVPVFNVSGSGTFTDGLTVVTGSVNIGSSSIQSVSASAGDGSGLSTLELKPDASTGDNRYVVLDPTAPNHIHVRAGGEIDNSNAYLYLGGEKNHVRVSDNFPTVRLQTTSNININNYYFNVGDAYSTAVWEAGGDVNQITINNPSQSIYDAVSAFNNVSIFSVVDNVSNPVLEILGSSTPGGPNPIVLTVNLAPPSNPTNLDQLYFEINQARETYIQTDGTDIRMEAADDIRIYSNDIFRLRNYATDQGIEITTDYDNGNHEWYFGQDGKLSMPGSLEQGQNVLATGSYSHAEGYQTTAIGDYSHAEGYNTVAILQGSHAEGYFTVASGAFQHVSGQYNEHGNEASLFIVGIGNDNETRKDGFTVDVDANGSGSVMIPNNLDAPSVAKTGSMYVDPANNKLWIYTGNGGVGGWVTSSLG